MADIDKLATDAQLVAEFAARVAAVARPAQGVDELIQTWIAQAALVCRWPHVRALLRPHSLTPDTALIAEIEHAADECRKHRPGVFGKAIGFWKRTADQPGGWADHIAALLDRIATRLAPTQDLVTRLDAVVGEWQVPVSPTGQLAAVQTELEGCGHSNDELLERLTTAAPLDTEPFAPQLGRFTDPAKAAVGVVYRIIADLASRSTDDRAWDVVKRWTADWLKPYRLSGQVILGSSSSDRPSGSAEVALTLHSRPGESVVFRLRPMTDRQSTKVGQEKSTTPLTPTQPPQEPDIAATAPQPPPAPSPWAKWAELPAPPKWTGAAAACLAEWWSEVRAAVASEGLKTPAIGTARARFGAWVETEPGREWFDRFLTEVVAQPTGPAADWWRMIRAEQWCRAYPDIDPSADPPRPVWPADTRLAWPTSVSTAAEAPVGHILDVRRYAPSGEFARLVLSDGQPEPGSALARFHRLYETTGDDPRWWADGRWEEAREVSLHPPAVPDRTASLVGHWLDLFTLPPPLTDNVRFQALLAWADAFGLVVTPATPGPSPGVVVQSDFSNIQRGEIVRATGWGLTAGDRVFRQAHVELSLGPAPPGFLDLEAAAAKLPPNNPLRERVARFRDALCGDYLREEAMDLYRDTWGEVGAPLRATDPTAASEFAGQVTAFLGAAYNLAPFSPATIHDYPDGWLAVVSGGRAMTGLIRRVYRPGLQDEHNNLCIPAQVEVE